MSMTESEKYIEIIKSLDCENITSIVCEYNKAGCSDCSFMIAKNKAIQALEEIQQYREYKEIFESHFSEDPLKLFSDKEEFSKWFERGKWHVLKCDELGREVEAYRAIGTVSEFRELKEIDEDLRIKYCYEDLSSAENRGYLQGCNEGVDEFAKFLHKKAKKNNGLRLSSETRSWTHPSIFDYVEEFKSEEICRTEED